MTETKETTPKGVQTAPAPSKPVAPQTASATVAAKQKPDHEVASLASGEGTPTSKATDTPSTDLGKGGTVATTANLSENKGAEPGTLNTPNPTPQAAGQVDTPPAVGLENRSSEEPSGKAPEPDANALPVPGESELAKLDKELGYDSGLSDEEKADVKLEAIDEQRDLDEQRSHDKFVSIVASLPATTPDSAIFGGYGGITINWGDIRAVARRTRRDAV